METLQPANVEMDIFRPPSDSTLILLLETPTLVSAFQIFIKLRNELVRREKQHSKSLNLISKTIIFCQEKNKPVYVMWTNNQILPEISVDMPPHPPPLPSGERGRGKFQIC
jgi:hypothetical protein